MSTNGTRTKTDVEWLKKANDEHKESLNNISTKLDFMLNKFEKGTGKIASNRTAITYLKWAVGFCFTLIIGTMSLIFA